MTCTTLLVFIAFCFGAGLADINDDHITISPNQECPSGACLTLSQFANNFSSESYVYNDSNLTLEFLPGNHTLPSQLSFMNFRNVSMFANFDMSSNSSQPALIFCDSNARFEFLHVQTVQISRLNFTGCTGNKVENVEQFTLVDSSFAGVEGKIGTALKLNQTSANISRSSFIDNKGDSYHSIRCSRYTVISVTAGGAIFITESQVTIERSTFERNRGDVGGAIFTKLNSNITIISSNFVENHATLEAHNIRLGCSGGSGCYCGGGGGALYTENVKAISLMDSHFTDNSASDILSGGAISVYESTTLHFTITRCHLNNNTARWGGAIRVEKVTTVTVSGSKFNDNSASDSGGAVTILDANTVNVTTSDFINNTACYRGGAVFGLSVTTVTVSRSKFNDNSASVSGGAFYVRDANTVNITTSDFINNTADWSGAVYPLGNGGAVTVRSVTTVTVSRSKFNDNSATSWAWGGAFYVRDANTVNITTSDFINNTAHYTGGAVYIDDANTVNIATSDFINNTAAEHGRGGAVVGYEVNKVYITESQFKENRGYRGGALWFDSRIHIRCIIAKSSFSSNIAHEDGGVLHIQNDGVQDIEITESKFINNQAIRNGGIIKIDGGNLNIIDSQFELNRAGESGGILQTEYGNINMTKSYFISNSAKLGGALHTYSSTVSLQDIQFLNTSATIDGGVFYSVQSITTISKGMFENNHANNSGGTLHIDRGSTSVYSSNFSDNSAGNDGAVMRSHLNTLTIIGCNFEDNNAQYEGGVLWTDQVILTVSKTTFSNNIANCGGAIHSELGHSLLNYTSFTNNTANAGGVLWAKYGYFESDSVDITHNRGYFSVLYLLTSTTVWSTITFSENVGSMLTVESDLMITGNSKMVNNVQLPHWTIDKRLKRGGAITATYKSNVLFQGKCELRSNSAKHGGALNVIESKINVQGDLTMFSNKATVSGGGIYLIHSELTCSENSTLTLFGNEGSEKGGGVMATSSTILIKDSHNVVNISHNRAKNGGGLYFQLNSNLLIFKSEASKHDDKIVIFTSNSASEYGGAVYVSDDGMCSLLTDSETDCTFQTLAMYSPTPNDYNSSDAESHNIFFYNNTAGVSGNSLFGGLLDKCTVSTFAEPNIDKVDMDYTALNGSMITDGAEYLQSISNVQDSDVSSDPVRVCFCREGVPDCSFQPDSIEIDKGQQNNISISLSVVDQLDQPLHEATVYSRFGSGNFLCQNHIQNMDGMCTKLDFAVDSLNDTEELILSLGDGPCENTPQSKGKIKLLFVCSHCPIGFQPQNTESDCKCSCDSKLYPYFTNCSGEILFRENTAWVTFLNNSANYTDYQYLVHPYCPLDYCHPPSSKVKINLNQPNGSDSQCTNSRSGLLCSTCQTGFSLSLGSSRCIQCSTNWPVKLAIIIASAIIGGLLLVTFLLSFNLTVAVGTLNGIIFYANIVFANKSILLPSSTPNVITIFISWLNLEIGFDTCFYDGLDTYWKTLLQLAFPAYVIFLVILVIVVSEYSNKFAQLIGKRNPVATLTTLILLSYAKLLHNGIASLSSTVLSYPDHNETVWFPDATVGYLKGKHIALFVIAVLILFAGILYTTILVLWQWFLRLSDKKMFAWIKNQKLCHFIEPYHAPYAFKYRYWTGLLLLVRVILYIIFTTNLKGDPQLPLLAIIFAVGALVFFKGILAAIIYKNRLVDILETIMYFNLIAFSALTSYYINEESSKAAIATTSVSITFILLMIVIAFHVYKYSCLHTIIEKKELLQKIKAKIPGNKKKQANELSVDNVPPPPAVELREITYSVVEIHTPKI